MISILYHCAAWLYQQDAEAQVFENPPIIDLDLYRFSKVRLRASCPLTLVANIYVNGRGRKSIVFPALTPSMGV